MAAPAQGRRWAAWVVAVTFVATSPAAAGPREKCHAGKLKAAGDYEFCVAKNESTAIRKETAVDAGKLARCDARLTKKWSKSELKGEGDCPTTGDRDAVGALIDAQVTTVLSVLDGITSTTTSTTVAGPRCGDGTIDAGEDCDVGDLAGADCAALGFVGGDLACGIGCDFDTDGCYDERFVDAGATVVDRERGLEWEKKTAGSGCTNCVDDVYTWTDAMSEWLSELNGDSDDGVTQSGFDGAGDWRLPTAAELASLADCGGGAPCIDAVFGDTATADYWSSTSVDPGAASAYAIGFDDAATTSSGKGTTARVRAVRTR